MADLLQRISSHYSSMHYVTIAALLLVVLVQGVERGFSLNLPAAVVTASLLDVAAKTFWLKKTPEMPLSAIITGLIIGTVSFSAPLLGVLVASVLAIGSKFFIRLNGAHVFNPAVFGVVAAKVLDPSTHSAVANAVGHAASAADGFGPGGFAVSLVLVPFLYFANYRATKLWTSILHLITAAILFLLTGLAGFGQGILLFLEALPWYFAFIIVSEPKTSPYSRNGQLAFGVGTAVLSVLPAFAGFYSHLGALATLLVANVAYAVYKHMIQR